MMRILLVEDDNRVADALRSALRRAGYEVLRAGTAAAALAAPAVDLVLLDLGLPDCDGLDVCRALRRRGDVAIIAVTARGEPRDRVLGLRTGADDYVVKPFAFTELEARIQAVMRRARHAPPAAEPRVVTAGAVRVDLPARQVTTGGRPVDLTRKEFEVLALLARESGTVVARDRILAEVWQAMDRDASRSLDVHIATLRAKLADPGVISTVRGVGYRLNAVREGAGTEGDAGAGGV
jgi:DNA-binding response OmpR family regulator